MAVFKPRNDYVLVRIVEVGESPGGIALPEISIEGKQFVGLEIGDKVFMTGRPGVEYFPMPKSSGSFSGIVLKRLPDSLQWY